MKRRAAAVMLAVVACNSAASSQAESGQVKRLLINGQRAVLSTPGAPTERVVVYVHGASETAEGSLVDKENRPVFVALLRAGFAVAADDAHGNNWGNVASVRDYRLLIDELRQRGYTSFYILAQSMGGLNAIQILAATRMKAWAGIFPVCNLAAEYRVPMLQYQIRAAYPDVNAAMRGRSPVIARHVKGLPMRFWASPDDTVVPKASNTDVCAAQARRAGARVTVTTTRGDHGDPSNFDPHAVVRLFENAH